MTDAERNLDAILGDDKLAVIVYAAMQKFSPEGQANPWVVGGNSLAQDEARRAAGLVRDATLAAVRERKPISLAMIEAGAKEYTCVMTPFRDERELAVRGVVTRILAAGLAALDGMGATADRSTTMTTPCGRASKMLKKIYAVHTADAGTHIYATRAEAREMADDVRDEVTAYAVPDYFAATIVGKGHTYLGSVGFAAMVEAQGGEVSS